MKIATGRPPGQNTGKDKGHGTRRLVRLVSGTLIAGSILVGSAGAANACEHHPVVKVRVGPVTGWSWQLGVDVCR